MNLDEQPFVPKGSYGGKLLTSFVALLVLEVGWANAAPASREEKALTIGLIVARDAGGNAVLPHGESFEVGITNHSDRPLKIWEEKCQPGHRTLTFRINPLMVAAVTIMTDENRDSFAEVAFIQEDKPAQHSSFIP